MSKKKVLNEVRRFMKLANLDANLSSNFVNKLDEMDHEYKRDDDEAMQEEEEMEMDMEVEEEPMLGDEEMEMDLEMDVDVEEEAVLTDDEAAILIALAQKLADDKKHLDDLESDIRYDKAHVRKEEKGSKKGEYKRRDKKGKVGKRAGDVDGHYKDYMGEELVQEVLKRVRTRLAAMSKK